MSLKINFNHWFFTASSFGSKKIRMNLLSQCRAQRLLDMMLSTGILYGVWGRGVQVFSGLRVQQMGGQYANVSFWRQHETAWDSF